MRRGNSGCVRRCPPFKPNASVRTPSFYLRTFRAIELCRGKCVISSAGTPTSSNRCRLMKPISMLRRTRRACRPQRRWRAQFANRFVPIFVDRPPRASHRTSSSPRLRRTGKNQTDSLSFNPRRWTRSYSPCLWAVCRSRKSHGRKAQGLQRAHNRGFAVPRPVRARNSLRTLRDASLRIGAWCGREQCRARSADTIDLPRKIRSNTTCRSPRRNA